MEFQPLYVDLRPLCVDLTPHITKPHSLNNDFYGAFVGRCLQEIPTTPITNSTLIVDMIPSPPLIQRTQPMAGVCFLRPISLGFYHAVSSVPLRPISHRIFSKMHFRISNNTLIQIAIFSPKAAKNALSGNRSAQVATLLSSRWPNSILYSI